MVLQKDIEKVPHRLGEIQENGFLAASLLGFLRIRDFHVFRDKEDLNSYVRLMRCADDDLRAFRGIVNWSATHGLEPSPRQCEIALRYELVGYLREGVLPPDEAREDFARICEKYKKQVGENFLSCELLERYAETIWMLVSDFPKNLQTEV